MAGITFSFSRIKAIEVILYLANRISDHDVYGICKLLYLADKTSLEKYGRFIFGDTYCAMKEGSTPSNTYDLLKDAMKKPIPEFKIDDNYQIIPSRDSELDYFSKSDLKCLDHIIESLGTASYQKRREAAHDAAWQEAWGRRGKKDSRPMPVESIAELFDNSADLIDYLSNRGAD